MTLALPMLLAVLAAGPDAPPGAFERAGGSQPVRVEPRLLVKKRRVFLTAGAGLLERGDYYNSPGATAAVALYPLESGGVELRLAWFFSSLNAAGEEVFGRTGLVPDAHRPRALAALGWRQSLAYGKVALGSGIPSVLHFDLQASAHAGTVITNKAVTPALSVAPGLLLRLTDVFFAQLDVAVLASLEQRSQSPVALGVLPMLTVGGAL